MNPYNDESIKQFVRFLRTQRDAQGRANLAELRRAAADPLRDVRSIWILGNHLPDTDDWPFDAYRLVAILYAIHAQRFSTSDGGHKLPQFSDGQKTGYCRRSFGESLRRLRGQLGAGQESLDQRFVAMLDTPREDLAIPLRGFIQRVAAAKKEVPVDYGQLLKDLLYWDGDKTRRQWARDYWQPVMAEGDDEPLTDDTLQTEINH